MKQRKEIVFTEKEAIAIAECLETLASMAGSFDEYFTKECKQASKYADKIRDVLNDSNRTKYEQIYSKTNS